MIVRPVQGDVKVSVDESIYGRLTVFAFRRVDATRGDRARIAEHLLEQLQRKVGANGRGELDALDTRESRVDLPAV